MCDIISFKILLQKYTLLAIASIKYNLKEFMRNMLLPKKKCSGPLTLVKKQLRASEEINTFQIF